MTETIKIGANIFNLIFNAFKIYFKNIFSLTRVMLFPVFGQVLGIFLILGAAFFYTTHYLSKIQSQNLFLPIWGLILLVLPGFALFIKAFWEYLVVYVSLNTMVRDIKDTGKFEHFKVHNSYVAERKKDYVILLLLITLIWLIIILFPFSALISAPVGKLIYTIMTTISIILSIVVSVKLCLVYQIFAFEAIKPLEVVKKSWELLKNNFWRAFLLGVIIYIVTEIIAEIITYVISLTPLINYIKAAFDAYIKIFAQIPAFMEFLTKSGLTPDIFSLEMTLNFISSTILVLMTPLGSACFTLLYLDILERKNANV